MKPLADLQSEFARALRDPGRSPPGEIRSQRGSARRFDVYRNNVVVNLTEALGATYPAVRKLVGDAFFRAAARAYIDVDPPHSPILLLYGRGFGDFLENFGPARAVPYLGDVARLEWTRLKAYHAADLEPAPIAVLAAVPEDQVGDVTFTVHPAVSVVRSRWPVVSLWAASTGAEATVEMTRAEDAIVTRPHLSVDARIAPEGAAGFLSDLIAGMTLGAAAQAAVGLDTRFDLGSHLAGLFQLGTIAAVHPPGTGKG